MSHSFTAVVLTLAIAGTAAVAAPHGKNRKEGHKGREIVGYLEPNEEQRFELTARRLELSETQRQQIGRMRLRQDEENLAIDRQLRATVRQYRALKEVNDPRAENLTGAIAALKSELQERREAQHLEMLALLTPEQRLKLSPRQ